MEIRKCLNTDINDVYELICQLQNKKLNYDIFKEVYQSKINDPKNYFIVGVEKSDVVGFLSLVIDFQLHHIGKVATIEELIVSSKYRGNGIGKILLNNAINYARESKCDVIELTSNFSRGEAHRFYEKNGFKKESYKFKMNL